MEINFKGAFTEESVSELMYKMTLLGSILERQKDWSEFVNTISKHP
jgi:hypothetical protein